MKAVIFDLDGTLQSLEIDFHGLRAHLCSLFEGYGLPPVEGALLEAVEESLGALSARGLAGPEVQQVRCMAVHIMDSWELASYPKARTFPGVREMLSELSSHGFKLAVQSRACRAYVQRSLERIGFAFDAVASRDDVKRPKPHAEGVHMLLDRLRCDARSSFVVGDHPFDIEAGRRAGTVCIGVLTGAAAEEKLVEAGADAVFSSADMQMAAWIKAFNAST